MIQRVTIDDVDRMCKLWGFRSPRPRRLLSLGTFASPSTAQLQPAPQLSASAGRDCLPRSGAQRRRWPNCGQRRELSGLSRHGIACASPGSQPWMVPR